MPPETAPIRCRISSSSGGRAGGFCSRAPTRCSSFGMAAVAAAICCCRRPDLLLLRVEPFDDCRIDAGAPARPKAAEVPRAAPSRPAPGRAARLRPGRAPARDSCARGPGRRWVAARRMLRFGRLAGRARRRRGLAERRGRSRFGRRRFIACGRPGRLAGPGSGWPRCRAAARTARGRPYRRGYRRSDAPDDRSCAAALLDKPVERGQQRGLIGTVGDKPRPEAQRVERRIGGGADRDRRDPPHRLGDTGLIGEPGEDRGGARREEQREIDDVRRRAPAPSRRSVRRPAAPRTAPPARP